MCDHFDVPPIKNLQTIPKFFAREPPCTIQLHRWNRKHHVF